MIGGHKGFSITDKAVTDWVIYEEPKLVKKIVHYFLGEDLEVSFDSEENLSRLKRVSEWLKNNLQHIVSSLNQYEKLILYIMRNGFGWIVYDKIDNMIRIISYIFKVDYTKLREAVDSLFAKFIIYKYERLKHYNLLFSPPIILNNIDEYLKNLEYLPIKEDCKDIRENLSSYQYVSLIAGMISYVINFSPRSSEANEIHKSDFSKMVDFFSDFAPRERIEEVIKRLSKFGFFEKLNNRIVINNNILNKIINLSINEQLFIVFLYQFMDKFDFKKSYFMTLKILANQSGCISLRELFFYYLNNEIYYMLKNELRNIKLLIKQEEFKFIFFLKMLESENICVIRRKLKNKISIANDSVVMNEPHCSLLNNLDFSKKYNVKHFIVEPNYEVIVEPYLKPKILFKLALIAEPITIQTISIFKITKESIYRSFAYGITKTEILKFLAKYSKHKLPDNVINGIQNFLNNLEIKKMDEYKIVQFNSHESHYIKEYFKNKVIEIEPHTFLVFDREVLRSIEEYCKNHMINLKYVENFLNSESYLYRLHESNFVHNIRHLHTMKEFFDFCGSTLVGTKLKIDNEI